MNPEYHKAAEALKKAGRVLLVAHRKPDGDTLGACLALHHYLQSQGKQTTLACVDEPVRRFKFLPGISEFHKTFDLNTFDLIVVCDAGDSRMTNFQEAYPDFLSNRVPILNIDHHVSNDNFGIYNIVEPSSASATIIVYKLLTLLGATITPNIAMSLMAGIYNDTGAFMHSNTNLETFKVAAALMRTGIDASKISAAMFRTKPISQLRLWGHILNTMKINMKGVLSAIVTKEDMKASKSAGDESGGIIDLMATVENADFAMLVAEDDKGFVKGSFRTRRDDVDVEAIAKQFGGGGHKKAAGFRIPGKLQQETVWKLIPVEGVGESRYLP